MGLLYFIPGCGGSDSPDSDNSEIELCSANDPSTSISLNHGHSITIPIADINSETPGVYPLSIAGHPHTLTLSSANITELKDNGSVVVESSFDSGHTHDVTITCVG